MIDRRKNKYCIGCHQLLTLDERTVCKKCLGESSKKYFDKHKGGRKI